MSEKKSTKVILCTTPIRPVPTDFPPIACTSLVEVLRADGYHPFFYDIDSRRPSFQEVVDFFEKEKPDVLGISAVVSTAYRFTCDLTRAVKRVSPKTKIILGGNLAASSDVLLRKCPIDLTVVGEGERTMVHLMKHYEQYKNFLPNSDLEKIKGISFINTSGDLIFTGYPDPILKEGLPQFNYDVLSEFANINQFINDPFSNHGFMNDPRSHEPERKNMKHACIRTTKGCVARCTFCHRWDKGYRVHDTPDLVSTFRDLKEKWNVGFFTIVDENFGSDIKAVKALAEGLKTLNVLFRVSGVRVSTVDRNPELIPILKEAGCTQMIFGMESGSPKMLTIMEKGALLEQNKRVIKMLKEHKMYTIVQLVIGMPGENEDTIRETIDFVKYATEDMDDLPGQRLSVNYFQALPGTPGYEYLIQKGVVGSTLDDKENYLLHISDVDASDWLNYHNVSEVDKARALLWSGRIANEAIIHFYKRREWKPFVPNDQVRKSRITDYARGGYFRIRGADKGVAYWWLRNLLRPVFESLSLFRIRLLLYGVWKTLGLTLGLYPEEDRSHFKIAEPMSLRRLVQLPQPEELPVSEASMIPLRLGR